LPENEFVPLVLLGRGRARLCAAQACSGFTDGIAWGWWKRPVL